MRPRMDPPPCYPGETLTHHARGNCPGRCVHDMLTGQCSWCRGLADVPIDFDTHHEERTAPPAKWTAAERAGECLACAGEIRKGDPITYSGLHGGFIGRCCGEDAA